MTTVEHLTPYPRLNPSHLRSEFTGKTVLITGGGYGIGATIAQSFAEANVSSIILVGRTESKLQATAESLSIFPNTKVTYHKVDITSKTNVEALFGSLDTSPDVLVNNAGVIADPVNFVDADLDEFWDVFKTNVYGTALFTQSFLRHRKAQQQQLPTPLPPAVILTLNTIGALSIRVPNHAPYASSKAALARFSEILGCDIPETTARFISIHPGTVKTDMNIKSGLVGVFPETDGKLAGDFVAWAASEEAGFLAGRFVEVGWDVDELVERRGEVLERDLFRTALSR
ncbi:NAD(P)-binding protein [Cadophora sp. DSE1049]|nr:NAD(P)-binding protein [Cadophora sp. DSE1049]